MKAKNIQEIKYWHSSELQDCEVVDIDALESLIKNRIKELEEEMNDIEKNWIITDTHNEFEKKSRMFEFGYRKELIKELKLLLGEKED